MAREDPTVGQYPKHRVVFCYPDTIHLRLLAERFPEVAFAFHQELEPALADAAGCTAFISQGKLVTKAVAARLFAAPRLGWIQLGSAGTDQLEGVVPPPHIRMTRAGGVLDVVVAEHALGLVLALYRRIPDAVRIQAQGRWAVPAGRLETVEGKRATILGLGDIGRALATRLLAMGASVTGVRRSAAGMPGVTVRPPADLDAILPDTDILLGVLPGGAETRGIIGARALGLLPAHAILVNVGRGTSLDQAALAAALHGGRLAGAALDVAEPEPLPEGHPLFACPNLLLTAHVGGRDASQPARFARLVEANLARFIAGEPLLHQFA